MFFCFYASIFSHSVGNAISMFVNYNSGSVPKDRRLGVPFAPSSFGLLSIAAKATIAQDVRVLLLFNINNLCS